jgi:sterol desaturase/sphingolipid hydroxylase (fatty acid hydroxylase superfamily)
MDFLKTAAQIYASLYVGMIAAVALLEWAWPRRAIGPPAVRWFGNFSLTILGWVLIRLLFPFAGTGWALFCQQHGLGLFNVMHWSGWVPFAITILALDATAYAQHYVLHRVPFLWRIHRTHHTDLEFDFSTGLRFHPFEAVYSTTILSAVVAVLGAPPFAVLVSQMLTVSIDFLEHANLKLPRVLDRVLRVFVVTPDMHRIHHSQDLREGESNFSNLFSWWDRIFGTYLDQPVAGHDGIEFGVAEFVDRKHRLLPWMLAQPFLSTKRSTEPAAAAAEPDDLTALS